MEIIILWFGLSVVAAVMADRKGRSAVGFFLVAVIFSPLIGLIAAAMAKPAEELAAARVGRAGGAAYRRCPMCAEMIRTEALKCRFCGSMLDADESALVKKHTSTVVPPLTAPAREPTLDEILARENRPSGKL